MTPRLKAIFLIPLPLLLGLILLAMASLSLGKSTTEKIESVDSTTARLESGMAQLESVRAYADTLDLDLLEELYFIKAPSLTMAQARLQQHATKTAREAGLSISSARIVTTDTASSAVVTLALSGDLDALTEFLMTMDKASPRHKMHMFSLTRRQNARDEVFTISIELEARVRIEGGAS